MKCYFLRHAEAIDGFPDESRTLSDHGRNQASNLGRFLKESGIVFDAVFSSPLVRARQTTDLVLKSLGMKLDLKIVEVDSLRSEAGEKTFIDWYSTLKGYEHILMVGHEPSISDRVRRILMIKESGSFFFPTAGMACLEMEEDACELNGVLIFFVTPSLIHKRESKRQNGQAVI